MGSGSPPVWLRTTGWIAWWLEAVGKLSFAEADNTSANSTDGITSDLVI